MLFHLVHFLSPYLVLGYKKIPPGKSRSGMGDLPAGIIFLTGGEGKHLFY